jgi:hypothetical protein
MGGSAHQVSHRSFPVPTCTAESKPTFRNLLRYLDSETDLDRAFTFLYPLPQNPLLYYPEVIKNDLLLPDLVQLLSHDNTDISLQVVSALYEMTDEDVGEDLLEAEGEGEDEDEKREEMRTKLRLIMGDFIGLLVSFAWIDKDEVTAEARKLTFNVNSGSLTNPSSNSSSPTSPA